MLIDGDLKAGKVLFAHGAGAPMDSGFMEQMAERLAKLGLQVVRFEFPYMQTIRETGKRCPPDRMPKLLDYFTQMIEEQVVDGKPLYLAGKSMGGRAASMLLNHPAVSAGFVFGYPFHPRGKPESLRVDHLKDLSKPLYIFQGERDPMGSLPEVTEYNLPASVHVHWFEDGDHDIKPRKASGFTQIQHMDHIAQIIGKQLS
ncbi:alpha/beta family hydrolase [Neptuniibacter sp. QD37_6]|uniref:alpha/beta family hydrolase n=1 Tax=Neptuniibacter sp. QD37_6 TaxID=3398210 RepID=UPI0039F4EDDC